MITLYVCIGFLICIASIICIGFVFGKHYRLPQGVACSEFQIQHSGEVVVGKNFDWVVGDGLLCVNKRGMSKKAVPTFIDKQQ